MEFKIIVGKEVLLEALAKNKNRYVNTRATLVKVFEEKSAEYQKEYAAYSQKIVDGTLADDETQPFPPHIPEDRKETYDRYITMVQCHCGDTLEIEDKMFNQLYLDKWSFIRDHIQALAVWSDTTSANSTSTAAALMAYTG